jgi:hypothetical protein
MKLFKYWIYTALLISTLVLSCSYLTGCGKGSAQQFVVPAPPSRTYSWEDIHGVFLKNGLVLEQFITADSTYVLTTRSWIQSDFSSGLSAFQFQMGINNWKPESNDCDKFSLATTFYAKWLTHSSPNRKFNASLAMGEVFYTRSNSRGNHAINFFIINESDELKIVFYEPQTRQIISLTQNEMFSIYFVKI